MFLVNKSTGSKIWKYHLVDEVLAAASAGMSATTDLDQRCLIFTIHLNSAAGHPLLCQNLFHTVELFFAEKGVKRRSVSYSGLTSFIDVNGSKFSGADRDYTQVHCHGSIFIPWNTTPEAIKQLVGRLELAASQVCHHGQPIAKTSQDAILFKVFDYLRTDTNLVTWTAYAQKETARISTDGDYMIFLPFDARGDYAARIAMQIENKRDKTLAVLRSPYRFKILSYL